MEPEVTRVLLVEDNLDTAKLIQAYLARFEGAKFEVVWKENGMQAIEVAERDPSLHVILMDYFLPGSNGLEVTRMIKARSIPTPIVFLTVNRDMNLAVEVMKLGVADYMIKEDISSHVFPQTLLSVVEKARLKREVGQLEVKKRRLEAMQEIVLGISSEITEPLKGMREVVDALMNMKREEKAAKYLSLIRENIDRLEVKLDKLRNLKDDKTVQYIKDIKMVDIS